MASTRPPAPLRILHVAATANGASWMADQLRELRARGHDVSALIAGTDGTLAPRLAADGIPFDVLDLNVLSSREWRRAARTLRALVAYLRRKRPDVVHTHLFPSIVLGRIAAWLADVPVRFSMIPGPYYLEAPVLRDVDAGTAWADTKVIASCEHTRTLYRALGVAPSQVELIYYGPDERRFDPVHADGLAVRRELGIAPSTPTVGLVAYFYPPLPAGPFTPRHLIGRGIKGHDVLLEAVPHVLSHVPDALFLLVGEGWGEAGRHSEQTLRARAEALGVAQAVRFTGARTDVPSVLAAFDVSVQCALNENLGGSLETLLMGRPIVASAVGGLVDSVRHETTGLLVPPDDPAALGEAIARLLTDHALSARLARAGQALARERFTLARTVDELEHLYRVHAHAVAPDGSAPWRRRYRVTRSAIRVLLAAPRLARPLAAVLRTGTLTRPAHRREDAGTQAARPGGAAAVEGTRRADSRPPPRPGGVERGGRVGLAVRSGSCQPRIGLAPPRVIHVAGATRNADWLVDLCRRLRDEGCDVRAIIGSADGRLAEALRAEAIPFETITLSFAPTGGRGRLLVYLLRGPLAIGWLAWRFRRDQAQVVHTHIFNTIFMGRIAAWLARVPVRVSVVPGPLHLEAPLTRAADRWTSWMDHRVIAGSEWTAARYRALGLRAPHLACVPYGGDARRFRPSPTDRVRVRHELGIAERAPLIGLVAYFYPPRTGWQVPPALRGRGIKGHEDFLEAAARVRARAPEARFLLVGGGWGERGEAYRTRLREQAEARGLSDAALFTGERTDVPRLLAACDVAVQCSLTENYGGTIESLLTEVPTVATRVGGMPETVRDGETGLLVPPSDPSALADAILALLEDPARAAALARAGRRLMLDRFAMARSAEAVLALYEELLDRPIAPRQEPSRTSA